MYFTSVLNKSIHAIFDKNKTQIVLLFEYYNGIHYNIERFTTYKCDIQWN